VSRWVGAVGWRIGWHVVDIGEDLFPYSALLFTLVRRIFYLTFFDLRRFSFTLAQITDSHGNSSDSEDRIELL
jgi:hypothetical protein